MRVNGLGVMHWTFCKHAENESENRSSNILFIRLFVYTTTDIQELITIVGNIEKAEGM